MPAWVSSSSGCWSVSRRIPPAVRGACVRVADRRPRKSRLRERQRGHRPMAHRLGASTPSVRSLPRGGPRALRDPVDPLHRRQPVGGRGQSDMHSRDGAIMNADNATQPLGALDLPRTGATRRAVPRRSLPIRWWAPRRDELGGDPVHVPAQVLPPTSHSLPGQRHSLTRDCALRLLTG